MSERDAKEGCSTFFDSKPKLECVELPFADDVTVVSHTQRKHQSPLNRLSMFCKDFGLTINLQKTSTLDKDASTVNEQELELIHQFTYHGSTATDNLSSVAEFDKKLKEASTILAHLIKGQVRK